MHAIQAKGSISPLNGPQSLNRRTCLVAGGAFLAQLAGCGGGGDLSTQPTPVHVNGGVVTTLSDGPVVASYGLVFDTQGNLFISDYLNHEILKRTPAGVVTTFAGKSGELGNANGSLADARFNQPVGMAFNAAGEMFVADSGNHLIRQISSQGVVSTFAGTSGTTGFADAMGTDATFNNPSNLAFDSKGSLFVSDYYNHTIRKISSKGEVSTFAGTATLPGTNDETGTAASFYSPTGLVCDDSDNLYVAEYDNHSIRKITPQAKVELWAGQVGVTGSTDGARGQASFNSPIGLLLDKAGTLYVADAYNHTIRQISSKSVVSTLAGQSGVAGSRDGTGASALFDFPTNMAMKSTGEIIIASYPVLGDLQGIRVMT